MKNTLLPSCDGYPTRLSAVTITHLTDPATAGDSIAVLKQDVVKLSSQTLNALRVVVRLGDCFVVFHSTNLRVRVRTCLQAGFVSYTAFGERSACTVNGLQLGPNQILACAAGIEVVLIVAPGYESIALLVPPDVLRNHMIRRQRESDVQIPRGVEFIEPSPARAHAIHAWGRRIAEIALETPEVFDLPEVQAVAHAELIETLFENLTPARQFTPSPRDLKHLEYSKIVRVAEDYAVSHTAERIHVTDLCEVLGVSERTLQYAFNKVLGMPPMAYLTRIRLHRARQNLKSAAPDTTSVAKVALRWGFWHFGDFSRAYRECFGELPSDTLRYQKNIQAR